ncbi:MAG: hypothetical protein WBB82_08690 [Limnothrix sp.]
MQCLRCGSTNLRKNSPEQYFCEDCSNVFDNLDIQENYAHDHEDKPLTTLIENIKRLRLNTYIGIISQLIFLIFCFNEEIILVWLIMIPLALLSAGSLQWSREKTKGLEKEICTYGLWSMLVFFMLRDIRISQVLIDIYPYLNRNL